MMSVSFDLKCSTKKSIPTSGKKILQIAASVLMSTFDRQAP